jgi:Tfp pilus assembly protein PilV
MNCGNRGFTIMEALAAAVLLGIGASAVMSGIAAMLKGEARSQEHELRQRLASGMLSEVIATVNISSPTSSGDFSDRGVQGYNWTSEVIPSGVDNLDVVRVTVTSSRGGSNDATAVQTLLYVPAQSGTGSTTQ